MLRLRACLEHFDFTANDKASPAVLIDISSHFAVIMLRIYSPEFLDTVAVESCDNLSCETVAAAASENHIGFRIIRRSALEGTRDILDILRKTI